jgi:hypothetical protein
MLEFGGHHLGLNIVIDGSSGIYDADSHRRAAVRLQARRQDRACTRTGERHSFGSARRADRRTKKQSILNYQINDLVLGPGQAGKQIAPEGLEASSMSDKQKAMLVNVISQWAGIVNDSYAKAGMAEIEADLNQTYFAWSGPITHQPGKNGSSYYRIQGPRLVIEFSPQGVGGDPPMHVHTIYRDPTNDYGVRLTGAQ